MTGTVITLTAVLPLLLLWAAYLCTALTATSDIRDTTPGRQVLIVLRSEPVGLAPVRVGEVRERVAA